LQIADFSLKGWVFLLLAGPATFSLSISGEETPAITVSKGDKINLTASPLGGSEGAAATRCHHKRASDLPSRCSTCSIVH